MTTRANELPTIITSQDTASLFYHWLGAHEEVTHVQGFTVVRGECFNEYTDGLRRCVWLIGFGHGETVYRTDTDYLWKERKVINDWIRAYRARFAPAW